MGIKHPFTSAKSDGGDATLVRPSDWNADHTGFGDLWASGVPALYVDPANGSDANSGRSPGLAKATIAAAYTALPSTGGLLLLMPGRHDVTTGLILTKGKRLALKGLGHWQRASTSFANATWDTGGGAVIFTSEATPPASLISWTNANDNEEGFALENVVVECKSGVTKAVHANGVNHGIVDNCAFMMKDTASVAIYLNHDDVAEDIVGDDASWWRVTRNVCGGGGRLFESVDKPSKNHNGIVIAENIAFFSGTGNHILLGGGHRCIIRDNNLEGATVGPFIKLVGCHACSLVGNGGESSTAGNIFTQLDSSNACFVANMGTSTPNAADSLVDLTNGSRDNFILAYTVTDQNTLYDGSSISDSDANGRNYWIAAGTAGAYRGIHLPQVKSGAGSPNGAMFGYPGDIYFNTSGGAGVSLYVKESGTNTNTGWVAIRTFAAHVLDSADHTISGKTAGQFLRATSATAFAFEAISFSVGGVVLDPAGARFVMVWRAPFACTVTNVRAHRKGGTGATVNARRNQISDFLASDLSLTGADAWTDGGAVQNTAIAAGDDVEIEIASIAGAVTELAIQVELTRP